MHVDGSDRGILELDLSSVLGNDEEKKALGMVKSLDLSKNELSTISNLQPLTALTSLDVQFNRITKLVGLPLGLTKLNVAHNQLGNLEGIAALPFLSELDISYNRIVSLSGLPRLAPLAVINATHNRIASVAGVESLTRLQVLHLDYNYLCTADDIKPLARLSTLKTLSLRNCPITELGDYLPIVRSVCRQLVTLDGAVVRPISGEGGKREPSPSSQMYLREQQQQQGRLGSAEGRYISPSRRVSSPPEAPIRPASSVGRNRTIRPVSQGRAANESTASAVPLNASSLAGDTAATEGTAAHPNELSFEGVLGRAGERRFDLAEQLKRAQKEQQDTLLALEQERRENNMWRQKNQKLEQQLSEARRVLADELHQVAEQRESVHRLEDQLLAHKSRADKAIRDYKYLQQKLRAEQRKRAEEVERLCVSHDAEVNEMQQRIRAKVAATKRIVTDDKDYEQEIGALNRRVALLTKQNRELTSDLAKAEEEIGDYEQNTFESKLISRDDLAAPVGSTSLRQQRQYGNGYSDSDTTPYEQAEERDEREEEFRAASASAPAVGHPQQHERAAGLNYSRQVSSNWSRRPHAVQYLPPGSSTGSDDEDDTSPPHRLRPERVEDEEDERTPVVGASSGRPRGHPSDDEQYFDSPLLTQPRPLQRQPTQESRDAATGGRSVSANDFAHQLKDWMMTEIQQQQPPTSQPQPQPRPQEHHDQEVEQQQPQYPSLTQHQQQAPRSRSPQQRQAGSVVVMREEPPRPREVQPAVEEDASDRWARGSPRREPYRSAGADASSRRAGPRKETEYGGLPSVAQEPRLV